MAVQEEAPLTNVEVAEFGVLIEIESDTVAVSSTDRYRFLELEKVIEFIRRCLVECIATPSSPTSMTRS
ncbi:hypothetical protein N8I84_41260 (plasmid) [Streptomyces cynarae]|uniref:Uncharacterized protein n=1 Tax=Streptomyces cynarae TaxID=2981134 RepID=A0ABY6EDZ0_9ACTN|nr:hypothetical protein [Streptomyces cynarae]UXY24880.1 hypothetical protein N8I84_41260 [Streptomyces cynarae]